MDVFTAYDAIGLPWIFVGIAVYVVTCLWLYRVRTNIEITHPEATHARAKGWVWGGWLVPVVSFWFPFQIVRDLLKPVRAPGALLGWWWAFLLLTYLIGQIGPKVVTFGEIDKSSIELLGIIESVDAVVNLIALALWLAVIRAIERANSPTSAA